MAKEEWSDIKAAYKEKFQEDKARFHADAKRADDGNWVKHTEWHWSRNVNGERLDYWPSRKKFQFRNKTRRGDIYAFIKAFKEV